MKNKQISLSALSAEYGKNVRFAENYGNIAELAESILAKGLIQPLIVEQSDESYNILSGHRRYAALNLLLNEGKIDASYKVACIIQVCASDVERAAVKLLANDGQPLTPYEWAAEVVRLSDAGYTVSEISKVLAKSSGYVNSLLDTWKGLNDAAKKQVVSGKVSMSLAIAMKKDSASDKLASLGVQVAAAAKEVVNQSGEYVSDKVLSAAVVETTKKIVDAAASGVSMGGGAIGADVLANIAKVKELNKQASVAAKKVLSGVNVPEKQDNSLQGFIEALIEAMKQDNRTANLSSVLNDVLLCFEQGMEVTESIETIVKLNKKQTA
jgi:ParB family chromosome partitioning protein